MIIFDYDKIRKLQAMIIYLNFRWGVYIDKYLTKELCDPNQYRVYFDNAMKEAFPDPREREEKEKEATKFSSTILLDDKYFRWMIDDERMACFCWLHIQLGLGWENSKNDSKEYNFVEEYITPEYEKNAYLLINGLKSHELNWEGIDYTLSDKKFSDSKFRAYHDLLYGMSHNSGNGGFIDSSKIDKIKKITCNDFIQDRTDYMFSVMKYIDKSRASLVKKKQCLENTQRAWREQYTNFPSPFSWVSDKNEEQCLWVWEYMKKNYIWVDIKPSGIKQLKNFITGVFDVWQGWTEVQRKEINERNDKKKGSSRITNSVPLNIINIPRPPEFISEIENKEIFLKDIKNAWAQKTYRDKRSKKCN